MRVEAILNTLLSSNSYGEHSQQWNDSENSCDNTDNNFSNLLDEAIQEINKQGDI